MTDLVERLRALGAAERPHIGDEAADRIEALEAELEDIWRGEGGDPQVFQEYLAALKEKI